MRIFWVDDEIEDFLAFVEALKQEHTVTTARSYNDAMEKLTGAFQFDLVVLDIHLDGANPYRARINDGFKLLRTIKERHPRFPIVVLSALLEKVDMQELKGFNFVSVLDKGKVKPSTFIEHIKKLRNDAR